MQYNYDNFQKQAKIIVDQEKIIQGLQSQVVSKGSKPSKSKSKKESVDGDQ
jgi:hypothetical protein